MMGVKMKRLGLGLLAWASVGSASAGVDNGANGGELLLYLWDPVAKVSYAKDLGISMDTFFVSGQQDAGVQQFWQLSGSEDALFSKFLAATTSANTRWALFGFDSEVSAADEANGLYREAPGAKRVFTTLTNTTQVGVPSSAYRALTAWTFGDFESLVGAAANLAVKLAEPLVDSSHTVDWQQNGSSFNPEGTPQYFDDSSSVLKQFGSDAIGISTTNKLGESSWFYYATNFDDSGSYLNPVVIDEFDNRGHDAYWGLARDPSTSNYVLSYTLAAANQSGMQFSPIGTARAAVTEYLASTGDRLLDTPSGAYDGYVPIDLSPVAAVPEPAACLLFGTGVLALIARRRSHKTPR